MNIEVCKEEIKRHEGEVLEIYEDSLGFKTLGVGHLIQKKDLEYDLPVGTPVIQEVVDLYYEDDFQKHLDETISLVGKDRFENLPEPIQHVLVNMCFNLGKHRLSKFKFMLHAVEIEDWEEMAKQMENSRWFNQVGRRGRELKDMVLGVL
tara:strand:- start:518 stop:967 length:450 start_codon:yes stop_codon:yes gene_type:complete